MHYVNGTKSLHRYKTICICITASKPNLKPSPLGTQSNTSMASGSAEWQYSELLNMIECVYRNDTDRMVIVKCVGDNNFYREKVVLPTEMFWFEAPQEARLEIWKMSIAGQMLHVRADVRDYAMQEEPVTESLWAS